MESHAYENCNQCLDAAEKLPRAFTAQEAEEQKIYMREFHKSHTDNDEG